MSDLLGAMLGGAFNCVLGLVPNLRRDMLRRMPGTVGGRMSGVLRDGLRGSRLAGDESDDLGRDILADDRQLRLCRSVIASSASWAQPGGAGVGSLYLLASRI